MATEYTRKWSQPMRGCCFLRAATFGVAVAASLCFNCQQQALAELPPSSREGRRYFYPFVATPSCNSTDIMAEYQAHASNISGIILYAYDHGADGLLTPNSGAAHGHDYPPDICEGNYARWKQIAPIYAAIGGHSVGPALTNLSMEQRFIRDAVAKALHFGLSGYNYDIEGSAHGPKQLLPFFSRFAIALHAHNMTLTSDVDGCPQGCEGISCAEYAASPLDGVVLMSWYKAEPVQKFLDKVANTTRDGSLGARKTIAGWSGSHWLSNCSVMDFVLSQNVRSIGFWADSLRNEQNWALLHEFLTVDPVHPPAPAARRCRTAGTPPPTPSPPMPPRPPMAPPFEITRGGRCLSASSMTLPSNVSLGSCGGPYTLWEPSREGGGICRGWSGTSDDGDQDHSDTKRWGQRRQHEQQHEQQQQQQLQPLSRRVSVCLVVPSWRLAEGCDAGQPLGLGRARDSKHLFTLDNVTGLLRSNNCTGMCAAAMAEGLQLARCSTTAAVGFHSSVTASIYL
jgi:hypothetical protein